MLLQSHLFTKTKREAPKDELARNAQLLIRAGFVHKEMAGVYALLPLGMRVMENLKQIVREEMDSVGGQEILMTALQRKDVWEITNRWDDEQVDVWFKTQLKNGSDVGLGWSHEEPITQMMQTYLMSYRDLPAYVYQFQTKFRNELRAKSGVMRGREFVMKDMYSYSRDAESHDAFYQQTIDAYLRVFDRVGVGEDTFVTFASGGAFTQFSHEFQTITDAGEDEIYINREKNIAINDEVMSDDTCAELGVTRDELEKVKTAEVGNIFNFGTHKSEELGLYILDENENKVPVHLGSYGIGMTRLMGVIAEKFADDAGLVWPEEVAPFDVHVLRLSDDENVVAQCDAVVDALEHAGHEVLVDDRSIGAGEKFADHDLIGIPWRVVVSDRTAESGDIEVRARMTGNEKSATIETITQTLTYN